MRVFYGFTSERKKCCRCGKMTSQYQEYNEHRITITLPLCDDCIQKVDVQKESKSAIAVVREKVLEREEDNA